MRLNRTHAALAAAVATLAAAAAIPAGAQTIPFAYPGLTSSNVHFIGNFPDTTMISAEFALTGNYFYTSSLDSVATFSYEIDGDDITVTHEATIPNLQFENESMTYGERHDEAGNITDRFVILAIDLYHIDPAAAFDTHVGGENVVIVDVTDAANPFVRSRGDVSTSTHTVQCLDRYNCEYAYSVGGSGIYSIIDMRDLDAPTEIPPTGPSVDEAGLNPRSPAASPNAIFTRGSGHYWDVDEAGIAWQTGSGGAAAFDVSDPTAPFVVNATDETGTQSPHNDFILHNSMRPNALAFSNDRADQSPSLAKGNVLLVTEEDYANDGDEVACDLAGEFSSWHIPEMDAEGYAARAGSAAYGANMGTITFLDSIHPIRDGFGSPLALPVDTFCSAHWFDYHETGIVAEGYYAAGLYFIDVRDPANLGVYGYATARPSEVWDAYWFPIRDADGIDTGTNTKFVMTADAVRGVDVFRVDLPDEAITAEPLAAPEPTATETPAPEPTTAEPAAPLPTTGGGLAVLAGLVTAAGVAVRRRRDA